MFKIAVTLEGTTFVARIVDGGALFDGEDVQMPRPAMTAHGALYSMAQAIEEYAKNKVQA